jgi:hypothetical protein
VHSSKKIDGQPVPPAVAAFRPKLASRPPHAERSSLTTAPADAAGGRGNPAILLEIMEALAPFVGARNNGDRDERGYLKEPTAWVDIRYPGARRYDADIRGVDEFGISTLFYAGTELIPWTDVREVRIRREGRADTTYTRIGRGIGDFDVQPERRPS